VFVLDDQVRIQWLREKLDLITVAETAEEALAILGSCAI
jgi:hypothetical protein